MTTREWHLRYPQGPRGFPSMPVSNWFILKIFPFCVPEISLFSVFLGVSIAVISTMTKGNLGLHIRVPHWGKSGQDSSREGTDADTMEECSSLLWLIQAAFLHTPWDWCKLSFAEFCINNKLTLVSPARSWVPDKASKSSFSCHCSSRGVYHRFLTCVLLHVSGNIIGI